MNLAIAQNSENTASTKGANSFCPSVLAAFFMTALLVLFLVGCGSPSPVNNKLRAEDQKLQQQIDALQRQREADRATIESLRKNVPTVPTLPQDQLDKLFTTGGIKLGRLTGADTSSTPSAGDQGIRVELVPVDQQGDKLKAAGSVEVDLFDLAEPGDNRIGRWTFDSTASAKNWYGSGLLYAYVFRLPWQKPPAHRDLTLKVTFTDALTGRQFTQQQVIKANPSASGTTKPASVP